MKPSPISVPPWGYLRLPAFPQVALRLLQLTNDENVQLHQLSELISSDAALASEVLTIANSAAYAPRYPTCTILQAIAVLGANHLQGICLTVAARGYLGKALDNPHIRNAWRHNLACAIIAEQLAGAGFMDKDTAYTAGLMHDIGRLALAVMRPTEYSILLRNHSGTGASILALETEIFGCNHCEAGRHIICSWHLPSDFAAIARQHHDARRIDGVWSMEELIKVSCKMADAAGYSAFEGCESVAYFDLLDELPARERSKFHPELDPLLADLETRLKAIDSI
jgi:putative nucleotidyltransferase with HDIG domain